MICSKTFNRKKPIVIANWKMNVPATEWLPYIIKLKEDMPKKEATIVVCPPTVYLNEISQNTADTDIRLGAQNVSQYHEGSFTGEVSVDMLPDIVAFVIVGHSERRTIFGESNEIIAKKINLVGDAGLNPILCVGESLEARTKKLQTTYLRNQLSESLDNFTFWENLIVAYEPIWAIGTGNSADIDDINTAVDVINDVMIEFNPKSEPFVVYGGSVTPKNIAMYKEISSLKGALIGGASLDVKKFLKMIDIYCD